MKHLSAADYRRVAWKNGAGETAEIAVFPPGAGLDDFIWRISMATVSDDGAFSIFPGIDRSISVIEGAGFVLRTGEMEQLLRSGDAPLQFAGDVATTARLIAGPVIDLNVMSRRDVAAHAMVWLAPDEVMHATGTFAAIFAVTATQVRVGDQIIDLNRCDLIVLDHGTSPALLSGSALAVQIDP